MDKQTLQSQLADVNKQLANLESLRSSLSPEQFQAVVTPLQVKKSELEAQLSGLTHSATVSGGGSAAQGVGATAVGERGVNVGGSVGGSIITGDSGSAGGIRANRIEAENVVQGMQQIGGQAAEAAQLVQLAEALSKGSITADSIQAKNVVAGMQFIADPVQATPDQLRQEVAALKQQLAEALQRGDVAATADVADAQEALERAEAELSQSQPQGSRIVRKLKEAADILTQGAKVVDAAKTAGTRLAQLAPVAAALYQIATRLFGG